MPVDPQTAIAVAIVLLAVLFLAHRGVKTLRGQRSSGCGSSCGGCAAVAKERSPIVQIQAEPAFMPPRQTE